MHEHIGDYQRQWYENGQLSSIKGVELEKPKYYDKEGNEMKQIEWSVALFGKQCNYVFRDNITGEYKG